MKILGPYKTTVTIEFLLRWAENNPKIVVGGPISAADLEGHPLLGLHTMYVIESDHTITTNEILTFFEENNLKSAEIDHLVIFPRLEHPEVQFPIVVLRKYDSWKNSDGSHNYPIAEITPDGRDLMLIAHPMNASWEGTNRFLALPK